VVVYEFVVDGKMEWEVGGGGGGGGGGGACGCRTCSTPGRNAYNILPENLKGRHHGA
jgi:hypothetical protein